MTTNLIQKNLKWLKIDIWTHSALLALGVIIPLIVFGWGFTLSDYQDPSVSNLFVSERLGMQILGAIILLFSGILGIIWQIISCFIHQRFQQNYSQTFLKVRKIVKNYYAILITLSLFNFLFSFFSFYIPIRSQFFMFLGQLIFFLFIISPIFWLIYYVNLFKQQKYLKKNSRN
jgi:hypothetical protein